MTSADPAQLLARLVSCGATVATAESFTGGLVVARLTDVAGSSKAIRGGIVAYHNDLKSGLLSVDSDVLADGGAVQSRVAIALAHGARRVFAATYGVGTTGVAGPGPSEGLAEGTAYIAVSGPAGVDVREFAFAGSRDEVRTAGVHAALGMLAASVTL